MNRNLFLCNTVYQIFVSLWIKQTFLKNETTDIIITDHMNNGDYLCEQLKKFSSFDECFYTKTYNFARNKHKLGKRTNALADYMPSFYLKNFIKIKHKYTNLYISNVDYFSQLLYNSLYHKSKCTLHLFEDGLSTYTKIFEKFYTSTRIQSPTKLNHIFKTISIYDHVHNLFLFNPPFLQWAPPFPITIIPKITNVSPDFLKQCNNIFEYDDKIDTYAEKYIFFEESFACEGTPINDLELFESIAQNVGKDNIIIKTHPRNPSNRFCNNGFKTNTNTTIPWEIVILNMKNDNEKVFVGVCSGSLFNPKILFEKNIKSYSLYKLVPKDKFHAFTLSEQFWSVFETIIQTHPENFFLCEDINDVK